MQQHNCLGKVGFSFVIYADVVRKRTQRSATMVSIPTDQIVNTNLIARIFFLCCACASTNDSLVLVLQYGLIS